MNQEEGPQNTSTLAPCSGTRSLQNREKQASAVCQPPGLWSLVTAAHRLGYPLAHLAICWPDHSECKGRKGLWWRRKPVFIVVILQ